MDDDLAQKINDLLNSEDGLNRIKQMAEMFGLGGDSDDGPDLSALGSLFSQGRDGGGGSNTPPRNDYSRSQQSYGGTDPLGGLGDLFNNIDISKVMRLMSAYSGSGNDDNTRLLLALKPMLSDRRQGRVDEAIQMMKLIAILPLVQESGILGDLFGKK